MLPFRHKASVKWSVQAPDRYIRGKLLQENGDVLLQESGSALLLQQEMPDLPITLTALFDTVDVKNDMVVGVDVSDTTDSTTGRTKHVSVGDLGEALGIVRIDNHGAVEGEDIATAFGLAKAALPNGGVIIIPEVDTHWLLSSQIATPDATPYIIRGQGYGSKIKKAFNGNMISLGALSEIESIYLDGNGANFSGGGVLIDSGGQSILFARHISDSWILDTLSYGVEFSGASAGYASVIFNTKIIPLETSPGVPSTVPGVKMPGVSEILGGNRTLALVWTQSNPIVNLDQAENTTLIGCIGGCPIFDDLSLKTSINGGRFVSTTGWTIDGRDTSINGVAITSNAITFASTLIRSKFKGNTISAGTTITDNAPGVTQGNDIDIDYATYVPTWAATGGSPAIGAGALVAAYERQGAKCLVNVKLTGAADTTWTGTAYTFSVPYTAGRDQVGAAAAQDATGNLYSCTAFIASGTSVMKVIVNAPTTTFAGETVPFTWATSDTLWIDLWYWIN